jgi:hypothetical protein
LVVGKVRQLLLNQRGILLVGYNQYMLFGNDRQDAVVAHLQKASACAQEIDKLFWTRGAAIRPKAASNATAHYNAITMIICHILMFLSHGLDNPVSYSAKLNINF